MNLKKEVEEKIGKDLESWVSSLPDSLHEAVRISLSVMHDMALYVADEGKANNRLSKSARQALLTDMRFRLGVLFAALSGSDKEEADETDEVTSSVQDSLDMMLEVLASISVRRSTETVRSNLYTAYWRLKEEEAKIEKEDNK